MLYNGFVSDDSLLLLCSSFKQGIGHVEVQILTTIMIGTATMSRIAMRVDVALFPRRYSDHSTSASTIVDLMLMADIQ